MEIRMYVLLIFMILCQSRILHNEASINKKMNKFYLKINEASLDRVKMECYRFGLVYKEVLVSNYHLFETNEQLNIGGLRDYFRNEILEVQAFQMLEVYFSGVSLSTRSSKALLRISHWKRNADKNTMCWPYYDMGIQEAWWEGYTGKGIVVGVVDTGVEVTHPDLQKNVDANKSVSCFNDSLNASLLPEYPEFDEILNHGTLVAGLITSEFGNMNCAGGVAYNATLAVLKALQLKEIAPGIPLQGVFDSYVEKALSTNNDQIDIYSCSFTERNPFKPSASTLTEVLRFGTAQGRQGRGNIYVIAAGDNQYQAYDCNGYPMVASIHTIAIASVGKNGTRPRYAIPCSCLMASTLGDTKMFKYGKLVTTTLRQQCAYGTFTGTSAATALASGMLALLLEANSKLTWRDVQYLIILTSSLDNLDSGNLTVTNAIGLKYNPYFGFGLMNAATLCRTAKTWTEVPVQLNITVSAKEALIRYDKKDNYTERVEIVRFEECEPYTCVRFLEHIVVNTSIIYRTTQPLQIEIELCSPMKTCATVLHRDNSKFTKSKHSNTFGYWHFTALQFWGEHPFGDWNLTMKCFDCHNDPQRVLNSAIIYFGTSSNPNPEYFNSTDWNITSINNKVTKIANEHTLLIQNATSSGNQDTTSDLVTTIGQTIVIIVMSSVFICLFIVCIRYKCRV